MSRDPRALIFDRLTVHRMPGISDGGYTLDGLAAGINVIHGPNASGKTTTARALESLLWPRAASAQRAILEARFHLEGEEWGVEVDGQVARYQCDGRDSGSPPLPAAEARDRYHLALPELLSEDNRSFAEEILRESAGGYDIGRATDSLRLRSAAARRTKEAEALASARARLQEAHAEVERLQQDERYLSDLTTRLEAAEAAALRVRHLERAIEFAEALEAEAEAEAALATFPAELAHLRGDEGDRLDQIRERLAEAERELEAAETARHEAEAELHGAGLPTDSVDDDTLDSLRARLDSLRALEQSIGAKSAELEGARRLAAEELGRVGAVVDEARLRALDAVAIDRLAGFAEEAGRVRATVQALEARLRLLAPESKSSDDGTREGAEAIDAERVGKGLHLLQQWLRAGDGAGPEVDAQVRRLRALGASAAGILVAVGLTLLLLGFFALGTHPDLIQPGHTAPGHAASALASRGTASLVVALAVLLTGAVLLSLIVRRGPAAADPRLVHRREYERLGLEPPHAWTPEGVADRVDRLESRRAEGRLAEARAAERGRIEDELAAARAAAAPLDDKRQELASTFGVTPELDPTAFHVLANRISRWQDAEGRATALTAELDLLRADHSSTLAAAAGTLAGFGYTALADLPGLVGAFEGLARRVERHRDAARELRHAENRASTAKREIDTLIAERRAIFERVGVLPAGGASVQGELPVEGGAPPARDPEALIREWCGLHASYTDAVKRRQAAEAVRRGAYERLTGLAATPGHEPTLGGGQSALEGQIALGGRDADELRAELAAATALAAGAGELRDEIAEIRTRLQIARRAHDVEDALAEVERCEELLREARERDVLGAVGQVLVDYLQRATRDEQRPAVFHRARELFALITRGRYRLDFDDGANPAFRAIDETTGRGQPLDELSSATRVQLLLAVRIAFVESQEAGARLPLIFDETLGNSDDDRAAAIMDATIALAAAGRQVFYFTAQHDEVVKWRAALEGAAGVEWAVIDLAGIRQLARSEAVPLAPATQDPRPAPPAPVGLSHDDYGQILAVPGLDLSSDPGGVHLWHLVEDTELLHRLLTLRIESWGALRSLVEYGGEALLGDDVRAYPRIRAAARALETALELARIGRGRAVDRDAIDASEAVTPTFMERMVQLLEEVEGDAARLIESIEGGALPRFQAARRELLRDYLEEHGYLDPRDPIAPDELRARTFAAVTEEITNGVLEAGVVERIIARLPVAQPSGKVPG